jgi:hypothetical protein
MYKLAQRIKCGIVFLGHFPNCSRPEVGLVVEEVEKKKGATSIMGREGG